MNSVTLTGNLATDVELREFGEDKKLATFLLAVDRVGKNDEADFFRVAAWDQQAQLCADYLAKGRKVGVEGRLRYHAWGRATRREAESRSSRTASSFSGLVPLSQVRRWCRSKPPSPRKRSIASAHGSGRSPIRRCPQPGMTRRRARSRRVYSNASSRGS